METYIVRHRRENLKKCTLHGLEGRPDLRFFSYPGVQLPDLSGYFVLTLDAPVLSKEDIDLGMLLIDGTWRLAAHMEKQLPLGLKRRSLPAHYVTAYPRRQTECTDPARGLASVEALFLAYTLLGRPAMDLLDKYYWKDLFLKSNGFV